MNGNFSYCNLCGGNHDADDCEAAKHALAVVNSGPFNVRGLRAELSQAHRERYAVHNLSLALLNSQEKRHKEEVESLRTALRTDHCTCVPLLRAEVKRLSEANDCLRRDRFQSGALLEELRSDVRELLDGVAVNGVPATDRVCEAFVRKHPDLL